MAEIVTYTVEELEAKRTEAEKRIRWCQKHGVDSHWARMELDRVNWLLEESIDGLDSTPKLERQHHNGHHDHHTEPGCAICKIRASKAKPIILRSWDQPDKPLEGNADE